MRYLQDYYRLLHVQRDAPIEVVRASFHALMREMKQHPDLGGSASCAALLNEAYETLSDPALRAAYDRQLSAHCTRKSTSGSAAGSRPPLARSCLVSTTSSGHYGASVRHTNCSSISQHGQEMHSEGNLRREVARFKRNDVVIYSLSWPKNRQEAMMIDLSPKGMRLLCSQEAVPGTVLKISGPNLSASAIVTNQCSVEMNGQRLHSVGVSFLVVEFHNPRGSFFSISA